MSAQKQAPLLSIVEVDLGEVPSAAQGFPPTFVPPRRMLRATASLNGMCCTKDGDVPHGSLVATKAFACMVSDP